MLKRVFIVMASVLSACGEHQQESQISSIHPVMKPLLEREQSIRSWAVLCDGAPAKEECDVGDSALFSGILCLSGEVLACYSLKRSQDLRGQFWRAPQRIGKDPVNSFSRDMAMGVLGYLTATRDAHSAKRWLEAIRQNDYRLCTNATDNRCAFTPGFWNLFSLVWKELSLPATVEMMLDPASEAIQAAQVLTAPSGYPLHLIGVNMLLHQELGVIRRSKEHFVTKNLFHRQPQNPFFAYLYEGNTTRVRNLILQQCPERQPLKRTQWSFERDSIEQAWKNSMGWECIALIQFLKREPALN